MQQLFQYLDQSDFVPILFAIIGAMVVFNWICNRLEEDNNGQ